MGAKTRYTKLAKGRGGWANHPGDGVGGQYLEELCQPVLQAEGQVSLPSVCGRVHADKQPELLVPGNALAVPGVVEGDGAVRRGGGLLRKVLLRKLPMKRLVTENGSHY